MTQVKSHMIHIQNASALGENAQPRLQNLPEVTYELVSSYTYGQKYRTYLQHSARESALPRFHEFRVIFIFFSSSVNPLAISILERVDAVIFVLNVSRVGGGVHGLQAIVSFWLHISTLRSQNSAR